MERQPRSPKFLARLGGILYLIVIVLGGFGEAGVRGRIVVPGDAAATAANLRSLESLWRFGVAGEIVLLICATVLALVLFILLRPVNRDLALLAVMFNLVTIAVEAVGGFFLAATLFPLGSSGALAAFSPDQLQALANLMTRWHAHAFGIALIFFGCECLVVGYLIARSGYLPRIVGFLMQIAGASYLVNSFALIVAPRFAHLLIMLPALIGEASLALWLLIKGVNLEGWRRRSQDDGVRQEVGTGPSLPP